MNDFEEYKEVVTDDIRSTIGSSPFQPIIFAGSGISIRYFSGPRWDDLLQKMSGKCPKLEQNYGYYRQSRDPPEMGELLADRYARWAWDKNESKFDNIELDYNQPQDIYLKIEMCKYFNEITPNSVDEISDEITSEGLTEEAALREIGKLQQIQPHAVITTNYDQFLERVFNYEMDSEEERYKVVVGEEILSTPHKNVGEILKIHGSTADPSSLILTSSDYEEFNNRRRYLSSKMLTYFAEHPVLIVGYSASDPNIRRILSWVNQLLPEDEVIAEDIYFLEYDEEIEDREEYPVRKRVQLGGDRYISVKGITAKDFEWVFDAFSGGGGFEVDIRSLRKILANTYEVVRSRSPDAKVVDHRRVEDIAEDEEQLSTILGISTGDETPNFEFDHNLSPDELYNHIGVNSSREYKKKILLPIYERYGVNITAFNNKYHIAFFDRSVEYRAYSPAAVELCQKIQNDEEWTLDIPEERYPGEEAEGRGLDLDTVME